MNLNLKKWIAKVTASLGDIVVYKENMTSTVTSDDGWAEYIYNTTLGISDPSRYIWIVYDKNWNSHSEVQTVSTNRITLRTWTLSSPSGSNVILQRNTHVTVNLLGILKPEFLGGGNT